MFATTKIDNFSKKYLKFGKNYSIIDLSNLKRDFQMRKLGDCKTVITKLGDALALRSWRAYPIYENLCVDICYMETRD